MGASAKAANPRLVNAARNIISAASQSRGAQASLPVREFTGILRSAGRRSSPGRLQAVVGVLEAFVAPLAPRAAESGRLSESGGRMPDIERFEDVQAFFGQHVTDAMRELRVETAAETQ